jgi:hypothetical protein
MPKWSRDDVRRMFGPGAAIIATPNGYRLGFGTVNPPGPGGQHTSSFRWATAADKPIAAARSGSGGPVTTYPGSLPGGDPAAAKTDAPAVEAMPDWKHAGQEAGLEAIRRNRNVLPAQFAARRQQMFLQGQQNLGDQGFYDVYRDDKGNITGFTTKVDEAGSTPLLDEQGNPTAYSKTYNLTGGSEGQRYRDDRSAIAANHAGAGAYFGSARQDAQRNQQAALNDARAAMERSMTTNQRESVADETTAWGSMNDDLATGIGNYSAWKDEQGSNWTSARQTAGATTSPGSSSPAPAGAGPGSSPASPAVVRPTWTNDPGYSPAAIRKRFGANATLVKAGGPTGKYTIKYS